MAATIRMSKGKKAENEKDSEGQAKLGGKQYERELATLHGELVKLQFWMVAKGLKVCVLFEGRDGAGKGGVIKAITERVSPRVFRVVALPAPTEREKSQMYIQRYMRHFPAGGEIVILTAAGTIAPGSSGSWNSARWNKSGAFSQLRPSSRRRSSNPASF